MPLIQGKPMFDLHCHILPALDDGAENMDTAIAMARIAVENGTTAIVATPHVIEGDWLPDWSGIVDGCSELQAALAQKQIPLTLYPGAEVALSLDILDKISGPGAYCINGGRYMLVELPAMEIPGYADEFFFTLQARGITPVIAHAERHPVIANCPEQLQEWVNKGILVQVNGPSLSGRMGERSMKTAELLLHNHMVHILGSDAHSPRRRKPVLAAAREKVLALCGTAVTDKLLQQNPEKIIRSQEIELTEISRICRTKSSGGILRWFSNLWV